MELPAHCNPGNGVYSVSLPVYYDRESSPRFDFRFQIQFARQGDWRLAPTVVLFQGGPGANAIPVTPGARPTFGAVPESFNIVVADSRGAGCNQVTPFERDALLSEYNALDNLSLIYALGLKNYYLYGLSYGTVVATHAAELAEKYGLTLPKAVILEGVAGKTQTGTERTQWYQREWLKVRSSLPARILAGVSGEPFLLGYAGQQWSRYIGEALYTGEGAGGNFYFKALIGLDSADPVVVRQSEEAVATLMAIAEAEKRPPMAYALMCREIMSDWALTDFVNGNYVDGAGDICPLLGIPHDRPYDSAQHLVGVPIYYIEGNADPTTPPEHAIYHFDHQSRADRALLLVDRAGHYPMSYTFLSKGCSTAIWNSIAYWPAVLPWALASCNWKTEVRFKKTGE